MLAGGALLFSTSGVMTGCGGGGFSKSSGGSSPSTSGTQFLSGNVNTQEIGGTNLTILSASQVASRVDNKGSFTTTVSTQGAQLLCVADGNNKLRGAKISLPAIVTTATSQSTTYPHDGTTPLIDAASTALALVFLTPGILSVDITTATTRIIQIQNLLSFTPLVTFLAENLPASSLGDLQNSTNLKSLKSTCISDYVSQFQPMLRSRVLAIGANFDATLVVGSPSTVNLTNSDPRILSIVREELDANGNRINNPTPLTFRNSLIGKEFGLLDGATTVDWGSIFTSIITKGKQGIGQPGTGKDIPDLTVPNVAAIKYWLYGSGGAPDTDTPDFDVSLFDQDALYTSLLYYIIYPFIDLIIGSLGIIKQGGEAAQIVWNTIKLQVDGSGLLYAYKNGNLTARIAATFNFVVDLLQANAEAIVAALISASLIPEGAVAAEYLVPVLFFTSFIFSIENLRIVNEAYTYLPNIASVTVSISSGKVTVN